VNVSDLAAAARARGEPVAWFEQLYAGAGDASAIPWADLRPHPGAVEWLDRHPQSGRALVVGCGLGDDAEELARRGLEVTAFDVSPSAVAWCRRRFPATRVEYVVADAFALPAVWEGAFDFVLEIYTVQSLPPELHTPLAAVIARTAAPGGTLLAIARARTGAVFAGPPWLLTEEELRGLFAGLELEGIEAYADAEAPELRRLRGSWRRPA